MPVGSEGLDYFLAEAEQYSIKVILTLTNYQVSPRSFHCSGLASNPAVAMPTACHEAMFFTPAAADVRLSDWPCHRGSPS